MKERFMGTDAEKSFSAAGVVARDWGWRHASRKDFALRHVDFTIQPGERVLLLGASGAGKSTLVRCINLLERPTKGRVFVNGAELTSLNEKELRNERKKIGMIFQHFNLMSQRTVYQNIA